MNPVTYNLTYKLENITRPANTTAYSASGTAINDNTARVLVFPATVNKRGGYITRAELVTNNNAHTGAIRLHLFANNPGVVADQSTLGGLSYTVGQSYEGYIDFTTFIALGAFAVSEGALSARPMAMQSGTADNNLYGILEARAAFTPTSGQQFALQLYTEYSA